MALREDLETLVNFGLFNDAAVEKLANLIRTVQSLSLAGASLSGGTEGKMPTASKRRGPGRPPGRPAMGAGDGMGRKRAPRGSFNPTKEELAKLRETMTAKQIAEKFGVSPMTVSQRASKLGLTTPRKKGKK